MPARQTGQYSIHRCGSRAGGGSARQCVQCVGRCLRSELFDRSIFDKNRIITPMALHDLRGRRAVGSASGPSLHARYSRRVPIPQTERDCRGVAFRLQAAVGMSYSSTLQSYSLPRSTLAPYSHTPYYRLQALQLWAFYLRALWR